MTKHKLIFLLALLSFKSCSQSNKPRTSAGNFDTVLTRNTHQNSLSENKKSVDTISVNKFDDIKAFMGDVKGKWQSYYITKKRQDCRER